MILVDGKKIAADQYTHLKKEMAALETPPILLVIMVGENRASRKFVEVKEKIAEKIGVEFRLNEYEESIDTEELVREIDRANTNRDIAGIVLQLPLPAHIDSERVIMAVDPLKDIDALSPESRSNAPVALAVEEVLRSNNISVRGKRTVVVGSGKLVGQPVAVSLAAAGADVVVVNSKTKDIPFILKTADIVVSGAGSPHFIKPEMLKPGVVLIDAGTSEQTGSLFGDIDPSCASVASLLTPVPGGIGPVTVAFLYKNLLKAARG